MAVDPAAPPGSREALAREALDGLIGVQGRRVLVTGAASGLGLAVARALVACGARVMLCDVDDGGLDSALQSLDGLAGRAWATVADVTARPLLLVAVAELLRLWDGVDVAFANAGISMSPGFGVPAGELRGLDWDRWQKVLDVNLKGVLATIQAVAEPMKRQHEGSIVATASTAGLRADPLVGYSYVASKAAIVNVVRQAALELSSFGVRVNAIAPGPFHSTNIGGAAAELGGPDLTNAWGKTVPLGGRMGDPSQLTGNALLQASRASSFMTGAVYPVDGGTLIAYPL